MRILAAWGAFDADSSHTGIKCVLNINAGIGIDYDEKTRRLKVALAFCNPADVFVKKEGHKLLADRLDEDDPETLFWSGTWQGDPNRVKNNFMCPLMNFFKELLLLDSTDNMMTDSSRLSKKHNLVQHRDWESVLSMKFALGGYITNQSIETERWTHRLQVPKHLREKFTPEDVMDDAYGVARHCIKFMLEGPEIEETEDK